MGGACTSRSDLRGGATTRGIVHRDLKPENVFLRSRMGGVKILDFGVAKLLRSAGRDRRPTPRTPAGAIVGTAGYMAPEQIAGARLDGRADLFALGVMMFEMLGGRQPFHGSSTVDTLKAVLCPPTDRRCDAVNPDVPDRARRHRAAAPRKEPRLALPVGHRPGVGARSRPAAVPVGARHQVAARSRRAAVVRDAMDHV